MPSIQNPPAYTSTPAMSRSKSTFSLKSSKRSVSTSSTELPPPPMPKKSSSFFGSKTKAPNPNTQEIAKPMNKLIKSLKKTVSNRELTSKDEVAVASQLADWGQGTHDDSLSTLTTHLSTVLAAIANQENYYASRLEASRSSLKSIRSTEQSVGKSRIAVTRLREELQKSQLKNESARVEMLTQELERAEAQSLVAESQLSNVSRQKMKAAYTAQLQAVVERAEKSAMLAKQGIRLLNLLDDTPLIPPAERAPFGYERELRAILTEAEDGLREWTPEDLEIGFSISANQPYPEHLRFPATGPTSPNISSAAAGGIRRVNPEMDIHPMRRANGDPHSASIESPPPVPWGQGMYCASPTNSHSSGTTNPRSSSEGKGYGECVKSPSVGSISEYSSYAASSVGSEMSGASSAVRPRGGMRSVSSPVAVKGGKIRYPTRMQSTREVSSGGPEGYQY